MNPMLSPLRYPGGKSKFAPLLLPWFQQHRQPVLFETFAGGASVSLLAVANGWCERAVLVERDPAVAAFWRCVLSPRGRFRLINNIRTLSDAVGRAQEGEGQGDDLSAATWCIARNRTSFGGKLGKAGTCGYARWTPARTIERIERIGLIASRLCIVEGDGIDALKALPPTAAAFIDPPYPGVGENLYRHALVDHSEILQSLPGRAAVGTWNDIPEIATAARAIGLAVKPFVLVSNRFNAPSREVLIGENLGWFSGNEIAKSRKKITPESFQLSLFGEAPRSERMAA